jgi:hypothetical protein
MALLDHNGESEFPFSKEEVFKALCNAIPTIKGMKVETADKLSGRVVVKSGTSLHSWGEDIQIQLSVISENMTQVRVTLSPKTGIMFGGAMDMGKNRKNIEQILLATSKTLSSLQHSSKHVVNESAPNHNYTLPCHLNQKNENSPWYEKTWLVVILCIIFFPVGLYALWRNSTIGKVWKVVVTIIIAIIFISNLSPNKSENELAGSIYKTTESKPETLLRTETATPPDENTLPKSNSEKNVIEKKLKTKAETDWPDDFITQEFWVNEQLEAYEYMLTIENNSIKKRAQSDWPLDFITQKFWYNEQIEAKARVNQ